MNIEQCKETYEALKKGKDFIANIDKDFFLNFAELLFNELENKQDDINILQAQRDSMEYQFKQAKAELEKKDLVINEMASALYDYANLEVLIKCPAEYDGKYNMDLCKMNLRDRNCLVCIIEYFTNKVEREGK